jgi:hypothetical protein
MPQQERMSPGKPCEIDYAGDGLDMVFSGLCFPRRDLKTVENVQYNPCYNDRRYSDIFDIVIFFPAPNQLPYNQRFYDISLLDPLYRYIKLLTFFEFLAE